MHHKIYWAMLVFSMKTEIRPQYSILVTDAAKVEASMNFNPLEGKVILVTGANGLLGLNFIMSLAEISKKVKRIKIIAVVKSNPSGILQKLKKSNLIIVQRGDLTDDTFVDSLPVSDIIIHAAGSGIPSEFINDKVSSLKINTVSTFRLYEKLAANGRFLFISSSDVYNGFESKSYTEDQIGHTNTNHPRACYIEGKRTGETLCSILYERGIKAFAVRLSLTYGPGVSYNDSRVLPSFIRSGLNGDINLLDSGTALRTFCYVSDAIEMMWFVLLNGKSPLYNIGGIDEISIRALALTIGRLLDVNVNYPEINTGISGAPQNVQLNIDKYINESNKSSFINLEDGLKNTIKWIQSLKEVDNEKGI